MNLYVRRIVGFILLVLLLFAGFSEPVQTYFNSPNKIVIFEGQQEVVTTFATSSSINNDNIELNKSNESLIVNGKNSGDTDLVLSIAGFPIKKTEIKVLKDFKLIPGGQSIGVKLNTKGVLVIGHHLINTKEGKKSPGEVAGIKVGDMITNINGKTIEQMSDINPFIQSAGKSGESLKMVILRNGKEFETNLQPLQAVDGGIYRIGLYIRDSAAGIGTLTFIDPKTKIYGALGHVIADNDTKKPIEVENGQILNSTVTSIQKANNGEPGEKLARFSNQEDIIGDITINSPFGIFGKLNNEELSGKAIPITLSNQVKEGPAQIYTVIEENKIEIFDVEIISTVPQKYAATKGMVIKVTDKELLKKTGGIIQGMSGSPIVQDGKLIGAVTHVFVNDPTSGYGIHIEWMLQRAGINIYQ